MTCTVIGIYKTCRITLQELKKKLSHIITPDELSRGCVVIDVYINVKKSNTLCDYMKKTYNMHQWVKSATTPEGTNIDIIYASTECTYTESVTCYWSAHNIYIGVHPKKQLFA